MKNIVVLGLGKVGTLVATLLHESGFEVTGIDMAAKKQKFKTLKAGVTAYKSLLKILKENDAVVSCLPYDLNENVVKAAHEAGIHYFDLTEDVPTSEYIKKLSKTAKGVMAPQCGLAPGFIAIVGASLAQKFSKLRSIELRVGALPQHPKGELGYAFNWSPEGVVNEYLNDCIIIQGGEIKKVPALQYLDKIVIKGDTLESFTTSGGLGTMCETYEGKVDELFYKTMRYPGHMKLMRFFFHELLMRENRKEAGEILTKAKPPVNDDVVYVHAAVEGYKGKQLSRDEFVKAYYPKIIDGKQWRAISWTTACSIAATIEMVANGELPDKGFLKQEDIPLEKFLKTKNGSYYND
ncbi:MAG: saccharopine dehydrogenase C-terminal domain-containing protein [Rickettsiales bacterium]|nr:saccharopine dehydrogenase NADP-binding domain-containing protein [Pseudomonadota bacterium]MDA0966437.1 saccharopine dehydrogenase NADP-binding domain-containing protein [Pseudomonadota bacterium]MDG4543299.1 saccharopine dehydrogenase C-terminal domain-containing protein [Rickettsiales bacterium]MDG4545565.1 saccharopine dehydrogenase C-terminal domain-containing protein [Rickettsiales bacterium]MDG4548014.1 saccharopine dehydrogenase C-terminal domain-containing protein [Rickettsiales bac